MALLPMCHLCMTVIWTMQIALSNSFQGSVLRMVLILR